MISARIEDNNVRISCSQNQTITADKLRRIYNMGTKFIQQNGNIPVIVDTNKNVKLSQEAQIMFRRLEMKLNNLTLVIIQG